MSKEISKNNSRKISQHIIETNTVLGIDGMHHSVEVNEVVVSLISISETTASTIKYNWQC